AFSRRTAGTAAPVSGQAAANRIASWAYDNSDNAVPGMANPIGHVTTSTSYVNGNAYVTQAKGFNVFGSSLGTTITLPASEGALAGSHSFTNQYTSTTGLPW